jgi:hypothetical protein
MIMVELVLEDHIPYVYLQPAGNEVSLEILDWAVSAVVSGNITHIIYKKDGVRRVISQDPVFVEKYNAYLEST